MLELMQMGLKSCIFSKSLNFSVFYILLTKTIAWLKGKLSRILQSLANFDFYSTLLLRCCKLRIFTFLLAISKINGALTPLISTRQALRVIYESVAVSMSVCLLGGVFLTKNLRF